MKPLKCFIQNFVFNTFGYSVYGKFISSYQIPAGLKMTSKIELILASYYKAPRKPDVIRFSRQDIGLSSFSS